MDGEATIPLLRGARPGLQDVFPAELYAGAGGQATLTFPAGQPNRKLDYLFVDHAGLLLQQAEVPAARPACSDHRPVLAVLRLVE